MSNLGLSLCFFLSLTGSIYCLWILWDCWRQAKAWKGAGESSVRRFRRRALSTRIEWLCQFLFAATFLVIALAFLSDGARRALSHATQGTSGRNRQTRSVEMIWMQEFPSIYLEYEPTQSGRQIVGIDCGMEPVSDKHVRDLLRVSPNLRWLTLTGTQISDDLSQGLSRFPQLRELNFNDTQITDRSLEYLANLKNVERLSFVGTKITDAGLRNLAELPNLKDLWLSDTAITDRGLEHLANLKSLESLLLERSKVTDDGLRYLAGLTKLKKLCLDDTAITDRGLEHLAGLKSLERLSVGGTGVTAKGLQNLGSASLMSASPMNKADQREAGKAGLPLSALVD